MSEHESADGASAPVETPEVESQPEFVGPDAFSPQIIDPPADAPEPGDAAPAQPEWEPLPAGDIAVIYRGAADVADLKGPDGKGESTYRFRPGEPVIVPSEVAEELLTWPGEQFEVVKE